MEQKPTPAKLKAKKAKPTPTQVAIDDGKGIGNTCKWLGNKLASLEISLDVDGNHFEPVILFALRRWSNEETFIDYHSVWLEDDIEHNLIAPDLSDDEEELAQIYRGLRELPTLIGQMQKGIEPSVTLTKILGNMEELEKLTFDRLDLVRSLADGGDKAFEEQIQEWKNMGSKKIPSATFIEKYSCFANEAAVAKLAGLTSNMTGEAAAAILAVLEDKDRSIVKRYRHKDWHDLTEARRDHDIARLLTEALKEAKGIIAEAGKNQPLL